MTSARHERAQPELAHGSRPRVRVRRRMATAVMLGVLLLVSGCGFSGLYNTPLPGGADLGDNPYRVTATFGDVLDLVPQAAVKVNDVAVGQVEKIELAPDTKSAIVTMVVNGDVSLPANADARLRQSSLLGEKFVELDGPAGEAPRGRLADGGAIPMSHTNRNTEIEEVLGALSLLLNGGGIEQLATITEELNAALNGNEAEVRALLSRVDTLATELDGQKGDIVRAIDGLNRLSGTLVAQTGNLETALDKLEPGLRIVHQQRDQLVGMLQSLDTLSDVAVETIDRSRDDLAANLKALQPTLEKLAEAGSSLPKALRIIPMYPLPDVAGAVVRGDYANVDITVDLNFDVLLQSFLNSSQPPVEALKNVPLLGGGEGGEPGLPLPQLTPETSGGLLGGILGSLVQPIGGGG